jgi:acyl-CoA thioester hydrolase
MNNFNYVRRVHFFETDQMGIVHHSNYLRIFEETRVAWLNSKKASELPFWDAHTLAVLSTSVQHKGTVGFNQEFRVKLQIKRDGVRVFFQYAMYSGDKLVATGHSEHALLNRELKVCKPTEDLVKLLEGEKWTETWP